VPVDPALASELALCLSRVAQNSCYSDKDTLLRMLGTVPRASVSADVSPPSGAAAITAQNIKGTSGLAICDTCSKKIERAAGHTVTGPQAASLVRAEYERQFKSLGFPTSTVDKALALARRAGDNLVCDQCFARIQAAQGSASPSKLAAIAGGTTINVFCTIWNEAVSLEHVSGRLTCITHGQDVKCTEANCTYSLAATLRGALLGEGLGFTDYTQDLKEAPTGVLPTERQAPSPSSERRITAEEMKVMLKSVATEVHAPSPVSSPPEQRSPPPRHPMRQVVMGRNFTPAAEVLKALLQIGHIDAESGVASGCFNDSSTDDWGSMAFGRAELMSSQAWLQAAPHLKGKPADYNVRFLARRYAPGMDLVIITPRKRPWWKLW
jgi:hypothetical protein